MGSTPTRGTIAVYLVIFVPELSIELPLALSSVSDIGRYQSKYRVYFKKFIEPKIDGHQIKYVGTLDDEGKNKYLGKAKAMLFPASTKEAFGMVMIEAMACGTPVIAFPAGSVSEVVDSGITGFIVSTEHEIIEMLTKLDEFDRYDCRIQAESRFDVKKIAEIYLNL